MSLSTNTATAIQQIFIGLLGRPAKQGGLTYWTGEVNANNGFGLTQLLSNIVNSQPEYINAVAGLSRAQIVTLHFNYLFNRNPSFDAQGKNYWIDGPGAAIPADQLVLALIEGASAQDMLVLDNKVSVGNYITQNGASLTSSQAKAILATVNTTLASVDAAKADVDLAVNPYILSVADTSIVEGDAGTKLMTFTLNLDKVAATDVVIDYQTAAGTATAGSDYQNAAGTVTIAAGTKTASVSVTINGDTAFEADETLQVNFSSIKIANPVTATGTIVNDDPIPQTFNMTVSSPSVAEGNSGTSVMNFVLTLDQVPNQSYTFSYTTSGGTATAGTDYVAQSGQVSFVAGQTTAQVSVVINGDTTYENNETVGLTVSGANLWANASGTGTIVNDDSNIINYTSANPEQLVGTNLDDVFNGTHLTAQLGDTVDGKDGFDVVNIAIDGIGINQVDLALTNVEMVSINNRAIFGPQFVDFSNTGPALTLIESYQSDFSSLTLTDIQSVNGTFLRIVDTDQNHNFFFDSNAYAGNDTVNIEFQEMRGNEPFGGANISFGTTGGPAGQSAIDQINITSNTRTIGQVSPATTNYIQSLNVGSSLMTVNITGNADFEVEQTLDSNVNRVDASTLNADLTLDLDSDPFLEVDGALGDDNIDIFGNGDNTVRLHTGNDDLVINGNGDNDINSGEGNDRVVINGNGTHDIFLEGGNDTLIINGNATLQNVAFNNNGNQTDIDAGAGNDQITVNGSGTHVVLLGAGHDSFTINGSGNQTVYGDTGNDSVLINGNGNQFIDAGADHDRVTITGSGYHDITLGTGNDWLQIQGIGSNTLDTDINAGDGNDTVDVWLNHRLDVDLGNGSDLIILRADDVSVADRVRGQNDGSIDTVRLTNTGDSALTGLVTESETIQFSGIEVYDLENAGIRLALNDTMIGTAENNSLTVNTETATGLQTIDMTPISVPMYNFTLLGGANRDVVIANDATINSFSTLKFDFWHPDNGWENGFPGSGGWDDTLVVVDGATIRHEDTENITGLDRFHLTATGNAAQIWQIDFNQALVNQATGDQLFVNGIVSADDIVITVDPTVPAGSTLYITLDPDLNDGGGAHADIVIYRTSNVTVYINGVVVTEPQMNGTVVPGSGIEGGHGVIVQTVQEYTENTDDLGTAANDLVIANQLDHIQTGDNLTVTGSDTLQLNFAVNNPGATLTDIFENTGIAGGGSLDVVFDTVNNVGFTDVGFFGAWGAGIVSSITTGLGNDTINAARSGITFNLGGGNDQITQNIFGTAITVNGGSGSDTVTGNNGANTITGIDVELINALGGNDLITISQVVDTANSITVNGGAGTDTLNINGQISINTIYANDVEFINDSNFANHIIATGTSVNVSGANGNDTITVTAADVTVNGGNHDDVITVNGASSTAIVNGDSGNDTINVTAQNSTVNGGTGNDSITVNATDFGFAQVNTSVDGGDGNDTINVTSLDSALNINGGIGNDLINVSYASDGAFTDTAVIDGGTGDDTINLFEGLGNSEGATIIGGAGNDSITLAFNANGGTDVLMFGDIAYNVLQQQSLNTQGVDIINNFNFELAGPGAEDVLDFTAFLNAADSNVDPLGTDWNGGAPGLGSPIVYGDWTGGLTKVDMDAPDPTADRGLAVISANNGFVLNGSHITSNPGAVPGIEIDDNGRAVVIIAKDTGGLVGYDQFDVYFVQDVDSDVGQVWAVDLVATVNSITEIGAISSIDIANLNY